MNKENLINLFRDYDHRIMDNIGVVFYNIYGSECECFKTYIDNTGEVKYFNTIDYFGHIEKELKHEIDTRYFLKKMIEHQHANVICINDGEYLVLGNNHIPFVVYVLVCKEEHDSDIDFKVFCKPNDIEKFIKEFRGCYKISERKTLYDFGIATFNGNYIGTQYYDYEPKEIDIELNYNDDFKVPYEKVCSIIEKKNETGLILFYGEPGTGKSSVIKNLISKYPDTEFVFIDGSLLANATQNTLISYFIENQNTVFILEDCEKVLMSREEGFNPIINTLLNITDGIIGDVLGIKLICTFNTTLQKIDKALLRKGRLSLKYEFKKLDKKKVSKILDKEMKEDMTLADIYNFDDENDFSKKDTERKKMGFNK